MDLEKDKPAPTVRSIKSARKAIARGYVDAQEILKKVFVDFVVFGGDATMTDESLRMKITNRRARSLVGAFQYRTFLSILLGFECAMTAFQFGCAWQQNLSIGCTAFLLVFHYSMFHKLHWED